MLPIAARLVSHLPARTVFSGVALVLSLAFPAPAEGVVLAGVECSTCADARTVATQTSTVPRIGDRRGAPCVGACGGLAASDQLAAPASSTGAADASSLAAKDASSDDPRVDLRTDTPAPMAFGDFAAVPVGVPFLVGGTFASLFGYARTRLGRRCDGCAVAERHAMELELPTDGAWRYLVGGIHVAALVGAVVLVAAVEGTPNSGPPGQARLDSLRLIVAPTSGGAAVSLSGAF